MACAGWTGVVLGVGGSDTVVGLSYHCAITLMALECSHSMYRLKIRTIPNSPHSWTAVMSGELMHRSIQLAVAILGETSMIDLVVSSLLKCVGG
jgi:hypothetical protein